MGTLERAQEAGAFPSLLPLMLPGGPLLSSHCPQPPGLYHTLLASLCPTATPARNTLPRTIQFGHANFFFLGPRVQNAAPLDVKSTLITPGYFLHPDALTFGAWTTLEGLPHRKRFSCEDTFQIQTNHSRVHTPTTSVTTASHSGLLSPWPDHSRPTYQTTRTALTPQGSEIIQTSQP